MAESRVQSPEIKVQTTRVQSSRVLCSATAIELGAIRSASLPALVHGHVFGDSLLVRVESELNKLISCLALRTSRL